MGVPRGTPDLVRGTRHRTWNTAWDPTSSVEVHTEFGIAYAAGSRSEVRLELYAPHGVTDPA